MFNKIKEEYIKFLTETQSLQLGDHTINDFTDYIIKSFEEVAEVEVSFDEDSYVLVVHSKDLDIDLIYMEFSEVTHLECKFNIFTSDKKNFMQDFAKEVGSAAMFMLQFYNEWKHKFKLKMPKKNILTEESKEEISFAIDYLEIPFKIRNKIDQLLIENGIIKEHEFYSLKNKEYKISLTYSVKNNKPKVEIKDEDLEWL